jgi:hypothetical protein
MRMQAQIESVQGLSCAGHLGRLECVSVESPPVEVLQRSLEKFELNGLESELVTQIDLLGCYTRIPIV